MPKKGRKGNDQRVKGNVKSASSGRMVELMGGELGAGVIGFESVSSGLVQPGAGRINGEEGTTNPPGDAGATGGGEEVNIGAGTKFQVVMKQLGKKDTTTKLKALQEFASLCVEEPPEVVKANLNVWVLMYNKLSMDNDNRVREASHKALKACASVVKNSLGPHLRSIVGCWVSGIEDPYRPSASAARAAFNTAFSETKESEVFEFSFKTIISRTGEVVLKETPDTFSDPKIVSLDERAQRYERAVVMAVKSITYIFLKVSEAFLAKHHDDYDRLFSDKKFWKLTKHQNPNIRAASYGVITTLCEQLPQFITERPKLFCTTVVGSLSENDPIVVGPLWEAALMVIGKVKNWNEYVNVQKAILPGLWSVMDSGGHGCAKVICPCYLPLLSKLVDKVYHNDHHFAKSFLLHLKAGLQADRVRMSPVESEAVIQAYSECYSYLVTTLKLSPAEQQTWFDEAGTMLMDFLEQALTSSPVTQAEPIMSGIVRVIGGLLQMARRDDLVEPLLTDLQLKMADRCSLVLKKEDVSSKVTMYFDRVDTLVRFFHTPPKRYQGRAGKKFVSFMAAAERSRSKSPSSSSSFGSLSGSQPVDKTTEMTRSFIKPTFCTLCGNCFAAVSESQDVNCSRLLLTLVQHFASQDFVKSVFSSLDTNHHRVLLKQAGNNPLKQKLLTLCSILTKAARLETLCAESAKFTENLLESLVYLLDGHLVDSASAEMLMSEIVKDCPPILPLLLVKLLECERQEDFQSLLKSCGSVMEELLTDLSPKNSIYLWRFLDVLFAGGTVSLSSCQALAGKAFRSMSQLLTDCFNAPPEERTISEETLKNLLSTLCKVPHTVIENDRDEDTANLLGSLLHWCLHKLQENAGEVTYLSSVVESYTHLVRGLPDTRKYLRSVSNVVLEENRKESSLAHTLHSSILCLVLHRSVLTSCEAFWDLYEPLLSAASSIEKSFLPLAGLESFCDRKMVYTPFFNDLSSSIVSPTIPPSLLPTLFPAVPFTDLKSIEGAFKATIGPHSETDQSDASSAVAAIEQVVKALKVPKKMSQPSLVEMACAVGSAEAHDDHSPVAKDWRQLTISLCLALTSLKECKLSNRTYLEVCTRSLLESAVEKCLATILDSHTPWVELLVKSLIDRASSDGPLWLLVIHQLFSSLNKVVGDSIKTDLIERLVGLILEDAQSEIVYSALSCLDISRCASQLEKFLEGIEDPCLLVASMLLFPARETLVSKGAEMLKKIASKQANSEVTLFESLSESSQNPFSFCVLGLIRELVKKRMVPPDAWEFVLCSLVSLIQLIVDEDKASCNVNRTVFISHVFSLSHALALFFNSPFPQTQQATEWEEFFQPALQDCLLPHFVKRAKSFENDTKNTCLASQHHYLCQAVSILCVHPQNLSFEETVSMVLSQFYPQQVAAFTVAKRLLSTMAIYISESPSPPPKDKSPVKLSVLQEVLGKALEKIDMEQAFLEDSDNHSLSSEALSPLESHLLYHNTTSYVFTWLLIIEAMSQCDPESRGALSEWLKELSLFNHLLQGLLKFLTDSSKSPTELNVTLHPDMGQLVSLAFMEIARHLPSMLRQWYLSVDRQTNAIVNKFVTKHISPELQQLELQSFGKSVSVYGNMEVRAYTGVSEISVVYKVDEFSIELFVHLPASYPLQPPAIREGKRIRIDPAQWRKWLLQFNIFVTNQNGSLLDGILLWKSNLDKHFAGVDDCMICFSVIHSSNYSLPKMVCRTCKKKFHNACLYKWFSTSTKSTCPLCRNVF